MDFNDTPEEARFRAEARAWLDANAEKRDRRRVAVPAQSRNDQAVRVAKAWQAKKAQAGFAGITWDKAVGGRGLPQIYDAIWRQEESQFEVPQGVLEIGLSMCVPSVAMWGTPAQKERYIKTALYGQEIWCQLFSEPESGSDVAGARTRAVREGDDWVVNGSKIWTTGAHFSDFGVLLTRTDPSASKHKGLTMFIVDMKAVGIEVRPIRQLNGSSEFTEVFFTNVRIPDANRLGPENQGWQVVIATLMLERFAVGAALGFMDWAEIMKLARSVELRGRPAVEDGRIRERIATWYINSEALKLLHYRALTALSKGGMPGPESSITKIVAASQAQQISYLAMDLKDRAGMLTSEELGPSWGDVEAAWTWSAGMRIGGGTDEILRNIIAERILGLPPEPRLDKGKASQG